MSVVDIAGAYLDALVTRDPSAVALCDDVRRTTNARMGVRGADALRASIRNEPHVSLEGRRWIATGDTAAVFYDLTHHPTPAHGAGGPAQREPRDTVAVYIGERFALVDGAIAEIEAVYAVGPAQRPPRPDRHPAPPDATFAEVVDSVDAADAPARVLEAARAYLAALVSHDASGVAVTDDVWRVENGAVTADGAESLRSSLESEIMETVVGIDDERWLAAGDQAAAFYTLHADAGGPDPVPVRIAERFRAVDGSLAEIEAVFAPITPIAPVISAAGPLGD